MTILKYNLSPEQNMLMQLIEDQEIDESTRNSYCELNNKCDKVISKIKNRKSKSKKTAA